MPEKSKKCCRFCLKKEETYQNKCIPNHLRDILNLNENSDNDPFIVPCKCEGDFK